MATRWGGGIRRDATRLMIFSPSSPSGDPSPGSNLLRTVPTGFGLGASPQLLSQSNREACAEIEYAELKSTPG